LQEEKTVAHLLAGAAFGELALMQVSILLPQELACVCTTDLSTSPVAHDTTAKLATDALRHVHQPNLGQLNSSYMCLQLGVA